MNNRSHKTVDPLKKALRSLAVLNGDDKQIRKHTEKAVKDAVNAFTGEQLKNLKTEICSVLDKHLNGNKTPNPMNDRSD